MPREEACRRACPLPPGRVTVVVSAEAGSICIKDNVATGVISLLQLFDPRCVHRCRRQQPFAYVCPRSARVHRISPVTGVAGVVHRVQR